MTEGPLIYALDRALLTGDWPPNPAEAEDFTPIDPAWWNAAMPVPLLTKYELDQISLARMVPHSTYSLQQSDFQRAGFKVISDPWKVVLPAGSTLICLKTRDRYDVFVGEGHDDGPRILQYDTLDSWRAQRQHDYGWKDWGQR